MEKTLQDLCREAKAAQNLTSRELSQLSGVPLSSVNNFFASASKAPALSTVAPLCRVCGVSLDKYFGISEFVPPEDRLAEMTQGHETELELALLRATRSEAEGPLLYPFDTLHPPLLSAYRLSGV